MTKHILVAATLMFGLNAAASSSTKHENRVFGTRILPIHDAPTSDDRFGKPNGLNARIPEALASGLEQSAMDHVWRIHKWGGWPVSDHVTHEGNLVVRIRDRNTTGFADVVFPMDPPILATDHSDRVADYEYQSKLGMIILRYSPADEKK